MKAKLSAFLHARLTLIACAAATTILAADFCLPTASAEETVLRVGVPQQYGYFMALMQNNVQLPGVKVEYKFFPNPNDASDAILSGAVDIEDQGEIGPMQMSANGSKDKVIACTGSNGHNTNLIVRPGVEAKTFADLKGTRIAYGKNNNHKLFIVHLLKDYGLTDTDIKSIDIVGAEAVSAFVTGQVDATSQNSPTAAQLLEKVPGSRVLETGDKHNLTNLYCIFATPNAISTKEAAIRTFIKEYEKTMKWAKANPDQYAKLVAPKLGVSESSARTALNNNSGGLAIIDDNFLKEKQAYADEIYTTGIIRKKLDVRDLFIKDFNDAIETPVPSVVMQ